MSLHHAYAIMLQYVIFTYVIMLLHDANVITLQ